MPNKNDDSTNSTLCDGSCLGGIVASAFPSVQELRNPELGARKNDQEKVRLDLIDPKAELELGKVLTFGAVKYAPDNWRIGLDYSRVIAGVLRHINAVRRGEFHDPETGLLHTAHAMCGLMFLTNYMLEGEKYVAHNDLPKVQLVSDVKR